jgi:Zn-dependent protease
LGLLFCRCDQPFFLKRTNSLGANLELDLLAVHNHSLVLQVWLPDFLGVALRKADIIAKLFSFAGEFTLLHKFVPSIQDVILEVFALEVNNSSGAGILVHMFTGLTATEILVVLGVILISMATHEAMHAYVAHWLGDTTAHDEGRLTLNPLKHVDLYTTILLPVILILIGLPPFFAAKPVPFNPARVKFEEFGAALIGIAGPLTNLVLASIAGLLLHLFGADFGSGISTALLLFVEINVSFFVFNMIPFPPLDGSRLLYAFAPRPVQEIMYQIESAGFMTIIVFMLLVFPFIGPVFTNVVTHVVQVLIG